MKIYNLIIGLLVVVFCNSQEDSVSVFDSTENLYFLGNHQNLEQLGDSGLSEITLNSNAGQTIWNPFENFVDSNQFELFTGGPGSVSRSLFFNYEENKTVLTPFFFNEQPSLPKFATDTPIVEATYITGNEQEQNLSIFHTQNVSNKSNYAVSFLKRSFDGYFENQATNHSYFQSNFSTSSANGRYSGVLGFKQHKLYNQQNGGIVNDSLFSAVDAVSANRKLLDVNLINAFSLEKMHKIYFNQSFNFSNQIDSSFNRKNKAVCLESSILRKSRLYFDSLNANDFLFNYIDTVSSHDSIIKSEINTSLYLWSNKELKEKNFFWAFGINSLLINHKNLLIDTTLDNFNLFVNHVFSSTNLQFNSGLKYFFSGYRNSNIDFSNFLTFNIKEGQIDFNFYASRLTPSFEYRRFYSNHHQWSQNISDQTILNMEACFSWKAFVFKHRFFEISNPMYFNQYSTPQQFDGRSQVLQTSVKHELLKNKFSLKTQFVYQYQGGGQIYQLPDFISSIDLNYVIKPKNDNFKLLFGLKTKWFSDFHLMNYDPVINSFLLNTSTTQRSYFISDFEFKFMLKNVTFYTLVNHLNAGLLGGNYFTAIHYPYPDRYLKFGLKWLFLN
ncbi:MAG: hypothetical protein CL846_07350 [Crocinitomicaceae bacterium]|nr:hypothetical protein [Crocinitomicaceae bacterium]|tara:strand:+ start:4827 stop:6665 length:1839 start_codon:yes stop_codon:yes gene_type:complete